MAREIAEQGYLVVVVPMPLDLAVLGAGRASAVVDAFPEVERWAIGGHSLGGAMAANYAARNPDAIDGLALWAAYPASADDLSDRDLAVVSIYGTEDGLATPDKVNASRALLPADTQWVPIEGGNHAQFGSYGSQRGDNAATIDEQTQRDQVVAATVELLAALEGRD
jgi:pimeloyl-ACP methyl ester carboxylesterase